MFGEIGDSGYLKIDRKEDRLIVSNILFSNGYTVQPIRHKKSPKSYEDLVYYERRNNNVSDAEQI